MMRRLYGMAAAVAMAILAVSGCESKSDQTPRPVRECTEPGQRCKLGGGALGVCVAAQYESADPDRSPEGEGFVCMSQH
jgi:hypothetical protein